MLRSRFVMVGGAVALGIAGLTASSLTQQKQGAPAEPIRAGTVPQGPADLRTKAMPIRWAQTHHGIGYMKANVGSFKILGAGENLAEGVLDMTFKGTVLVSNLSADGKIETSGNVRREINDTKYGKQVYFGSGRIIVKGQFRAVQFFGRNVDARFDGFGFTRLYGEFDKNLDTGTYWYAGEETKNAWGTGGMQFLLPRPSDTLPTPRVKIDPGKG